VALQHLRGGLSVRVGVLRTSLQDLVGEAALEPAELPLPGGRSREVLALLGGEAVPEDINPLSIHLSPSARSTRATAVVPPVATVGPVALGAIVAPIRPIGRHGQRFADDPCRLGRIISTSTSLP
jgi:hypothetical protein